MRGRQCGRGRDDPLRIYGDQYGQRDAEQRDVGGHGGRRDDQRWSDRDPGGRGRGRHDVHRSLYQITQADIEAGSFSNTATVTGLDPNREPVTATSQAIVPLPPPPIIVLGPDKNPGTLQEIRVVNGDQGDVSLAIRGLRRLRRRHAGRRRGPRRGRTRRDHYRAGTKSCARNPHLHVAGRSGAWISELLGLRSHVH